MTIWWDDETTLRGLSEPFMFIVARYKRVLRCQCCMVLATLRRLLLATSSVMFQVVLVLMPTDLNSADRGRTRPAVTP